MDHERHEIHEQNKEQESHEIHEQNIKQGSHEIHEQNKEQGSHEIHEQNKEQGSYEIREQQGQPEKVERILYKEESFAVQGAVFEVYREIGCGFLEAVYQECLEKELRRRGIPFQSQVQLVLTYKNEQLIQTYKPDLICYGKMIVEIKAVKDIGDDHRAQMFNYLKATGMRLGLLVNFGHSPRATVERIVK
jgi:GxxExxY protein